MKRDWGAWTQAAGIRALKTMAQTAAATIGTAVVLSDVSWIEVVSASLLAGALSLLTSVAGLPEVPKTDTTKSADMNNIEEGE